MGDNRTVVENEMTERCADQAVRGSLSGTTMSSIRYLSTLILDGIAGAGSTGKILSVTGSVGRSMSVDSTGTTDTSSDL